MFRQIYFIQRKIQPQAVKKNLQAHAEDAKMRTKMKKIIRLLGVLFFFLALTAGLFWGWQESQIASIEKAIPASTQSALVWNTSFKEDLALNLPSYFKKGAEIQTQKTKKAWLVKAGVPVVAKWHLNQFFGNNTGQNITFAEFGRGFLVENAKIAPLFAGYAEGWLFFAEEQAIVEEYLTENTSFTETKLATFMKNQKRTQFPLYFWWNTAEEEKNSMPAFMQMVSSGTVGIKPLSNQNTMVSVHLFAPNANTTPNNQNILAKEDVTLLSHVPYSPSTVFLAQNATQIMQNMQQKAEKLSPAHRTAIQAIQNTFVAELFGGTESFEPLLPFLNESFALSIENNQNMFSLAFKNQEKAKQAVISALKKAYVLQNPVLETVPLPDGSTRQEFVLAAEKNIPIEEKTINGVPITIIGNWTLVEKPDVLTLSNNATSFLAWFSQVNPAHAVAKPSIATQLTQPFLASSEVAVFSAENINNFLPMIPTQSAQGLKNFVSGYTDAVLTQREIKEGTSVQIMLLK